ncbi:hypothetical protein PCASD_07130 [Puccinia coronata f. sp. avenae]|uniref:Tc1-like transposase DDE domain-containing protein n=1 Tax=Puccinia coronata f. sp. avenae TaxID=200324 RepID=A0A2N5V4C3_9BASI|nr:hypothetical protein PCASD_07130 [Puccinia coronata f. sp. avenae]
MYRKRSQMYDLETFQQSALVDPEVLGDTKETVFIFHDESTIHAKERPKSTWLLPGTSEIRSKNTGRLIHISDFILESTGRLVLSTEMFEKSQLESGTKPALADAATVIYPGSNGDPWWDMEQLCNQVSKKAIPIFEHLHPNSQAVFIFDCSSAHGAFAKTALRAQNMNLKPGGKQSHLRNSIIPFDDPCIPLHLRGLPQTFSYDTSHPDPKLAGQPKGIQAILEERGLWEYYSSKAHKEGKKNLKLQCTGCKTSNMRKDATARSAKLIRQAEENGYFLSPEQVVTEFMASDSSIESPGTEETHSGNGEMCCWSKIMASQSDFANERPLLQQIIEDAGHVCLFLPKFHCELNPIELFWSFIKHTYRKRSHTAQSFPDAKKLFEEVRKGCSLVTIRKYFCRIDRQISAYQQGYNGPQSQALMKKYKSHRCIPRHAAMSIDVLTS